MFVYLLGLVIAVLLLVYKYESTEAGGICFTSLGSWFTVLLLIIGLFSPEMKKANKNVKNNGR